MAGGWMRLAALFHARDPEAGVHQQTLANIPADQIPAIVERAKVMWKAGAYHDEIAKAVGLTTSSFEHLSRANRDVFPARTMGGDARANTVIGSPVVDATENLNKRFGDAFRPLPGAEPVPYLDNRGCRWPVTIACEDPLSQTLNEFCCGRRRVLNGERLLSYCGAHRRISKEGIA